MNKFMALEIADIENILTIAVSKLQSDINFDIWMYGAIQEATHKTEDFLLKIGNQMRAAKEVNHKHSDWMNTENETDGQ